MSARHRVSKLLLRQGIVYCGGSAWTGRHEAWLRTQRFDNPALQLSYEASFDAMLACRTDVIVSMRRSPRWRPTVSSPRWCTGWAASAGSHVDRVRIGVEIGDGTD